MLAEAIHIWCDTRKDGDSHSLTHGLSLFLFNHDEEPFAHANNNTAGKKNYFRLTLQYATRRPYAVNKIVEISA